MNPIKEQHTEEKSEKYEPKQSQSVNESSERRMTQDQRSKEAIDTEDSESKATAENEAIHFPGDRKHNPMDKPETDNEKKDKVEDADPSKSKQKQSEGGRKTEPNDLKEPENDHKVTF